MDVRTGDKRTDGDLPEGWGTCRVEELGSVVAGKALAASAPGAKRPYLRTKNVLDGAIDLSDVLSMPMSDSEFARFEILSGDVLLNEGQSLELVGRTALYRGEFGQRCAMQNQLLRFRAFPSTSPEYAAQVFRECQKNGTFASIATQTTSVAHLGSSRFSRLALPWPLVLTEQRAIAEALSDVDELITSLDRLIAKKRDVKQGAMQQLLTGKTRLPGFTGNDEFKPTEIGMLPDGWTVARLGGCLESHPSYGINAPAVPFSDKLPRYIRITDISEDGRFAPSAPVCVDSPHSKDYFLQDDDIVVARTGASVGKSYLFRGEDGPLVFAGFLIRFRADIQRVLPAFLASWLMTDFYWRWVMLMSMRSGQPGINGNEYALLPVPIPPLPEQRAIAHVLSDMDAELAALEARRDKTKLLKQGMMQELLTGKTRLV